MEEHFDYLETCFCLLFLCTSLLKDQNQSTHNSLLFNLIPHFVTSPNEHNNSNLFTSGEPARVRKDPQKALTKQDRITFAFRFFNP